ncbi:hypothetical protein [Streptomyces sp. CAU 1734]|uniref:hypothetical protein n=1 Tax=Streptomyces sp. CAU 1734 TaxID=3140360 RepID=UPI003260C5EC
MPQDAPATVPGPDDTSLDTPHTITVSERGSFTLARCVCGWSGPARRSRDRARSDARTHAPAAPES